MKWKLTEQDVEQLWQNGQLSDQYRRSINYQGYTISKFEWQYLSKVQRGLVSWDTQKKKLSTSYNLELV